MQILQRVWLHLKPFGVIPSRSILRPNAPSPSTWWYGALCWRGLLCLVYTMVCNVTRARLYRPQSAHYTDSYQPGWIICFIRHACDLPLRGLRPFMSWYTDGDDCVTPVIDFDTPLITGDFSRHTTCCFSCHHAVDRFSSSMPWDI